MKKIVSHSAVKNDVAASNTLTNYLFLTLFLLGLLILYRQVGSYDMINWDEKRYLLETPFIKKLNADNVKQMFSQKVLASYNPLVLLSFAVDYKIAKNNWGWYHNVNLFFHVLNTILLYFILTKLKLRAELAGIVTALFAFHPLAIEPVAWIAGRKDVLYTFFYFLSLLFYLKYRSSQKVAFFILSVFVALLSGLSKVQAITIPAALLIVDYLLQRKITVKNLLNKIPFFLISIIFGLINITGTTLVADKYSTPPTFMDKILYSIMAFGMYVEKLIFPFNLSVIHPFPQQHSGEFFLQLIVGTILVMLMVFLIIRGFKKAPWMTAGLVFYIVHIFPVLHLVGYNSAIIYERFAYVAGIGIFLAFVRLDEIFPNWENVRYKIMIPALAILIVISFQRLPVWKSPLSLWTDVIQKYPQSELAYNNRGQYYDDKGEAEKSLADYNEAIRIKPNQPNAWNNRCVYYFRKKEWPQALEANNVMLSIEPNSIDGLSNRAGIYLNQGIYDSAIFYYKRLASVAPEYSSAYFNLGACYFKLKDYRTAIQQFKTAVSHSPDYAKAITYLSLAYARLEMNDSVIYYTSMADKMNVNEHAAHAASLEYISMGNEAYAMKNVPGALDYYIRASQIDPYNAEAFYNTGGVYLVMKDIPKAHACFAKALQINPQHPDAKLWLAKTSP